MLDFMAIFVRRGKEILSARGKNASKLDPVDQAAILEIGDNDSVEVSIGEQSIAPPAALAPAGRAARLWPPKAQSLRLIALVLVILLAALISVAVLQRSKTPTIDQLRRQAGWSDLHSLEVGVFGDVPGLSECPSSRECTGFDVEIAKLVADWLGVRRQDVHFDEVIPENRERMLGTDFTTREAVDLDLVVAAFSITSQRTNDDKVVFAGPYLTTQTTVLTRTDHAPVESLPALDQPIAGQHGSSRPQRICAPGTSTSSDYLRADVKHAELVALQKNSECVKRLLDKQVDAVVTDAAVLAGFQAAHPTQLRLNNIASTTDEHWGIGLGQDFTHDPKIEARRQLVLLALNDLLAQPKTEGWYSAFKKLPATAAPTSGNDVQVVADDQQPVPWGVKPVRRWPWERSGGGSGR